MSDRKYTFATPVAIDGARTAGSTVVRVGVSAIPLMDSNDTRRLALLSNNSGGSNTVYLGLDSSVGKGVTQYFRAMAVGDTLSLEHYAGPVYGVAGNSGFFAYMGIMQANQ